MAARARYVGSPEHKSYPSAAGPAHLRADASRCPEDLSDPTLLTSWLQAAISEGMIGGVWEGDFPRFAWSRQGDVVYAGRLVNRESGEYKGYPLQEHEIPDGVKMRDEMRFDVEWEPARGVRAPELRETWARLQVWVGPICVTTVDDVEAGSSRRSVYVPLYPLAEWITFNWWFLRAHVRPAGLQPAAWTYRSRRRPPAHAHAWLDHHNLRGVGEGFSWPDLTVLPEGSTTQLVWRQDPALVASPVRYCAEGGAVVDSGDLLGALSRLVKSVITRLDEKGVRDTALHKEWEAVEQSGSDPDEEAFCLGAARLGFDPYAEGRAVADELTQASEQLESRLLDDFLNAVSPRRITAGLAWIQRGTADIAAASRIGASLTELRQALTLRVGPPLNGRPWDDGYAAAGHARALLGLGATDPVDIDALLTTAELPSGDPALQAIGGTSSSDSAFLLLGRPLQPTSARFAAGRALWDFMFEPDAGRFLLTRAHTDRQKAERAFAAELLAPAAGLREVLGTEGPVTPEELEAVAEHFQVSLRVVAHQVENQLHLDMTAF